MSFMSKIRNVFVGVRVRGQRRAEARRRLYVGSRKYGIIRHQKTIKVDAKVAEKHKLEVTGTDTIDPTMVWVRITRPQLVLREYMPSRRRRHRYLVKAGA